MNLYSSLVDVPIVTCDGFFEFASRQRPLPGNSVYDNLLDTL